MILSHFLTHGCRALSRLLARSPCPSPLLSSFSGRQVGARSKSNYQVGIDIGMKHWNRKELARLDLRAAGVACGLSFMVGSTMAFTDFALLKLKLREPPTGWRVWVMGILAPLPVLFLWQKLIKFAITGVPQFLLVLFGPMLAVALIARFVLGTRPASWD